MDIDLKKFFDRIPQDKLMRFVHNMLSNIMLIKFGRKENPAEKKSF